MCHDAPMAMTRRGFGVLAAGAAVAAAAPVRAGALLDGLARLKAAYPDFIAAVDERFVHWADGTAMPVSLYPAARPMVEKVRLPDLGAQVTAVYPKGPAPVPLDPEVDPGRVRYAPFFERMYGATRAAVERNLVRVPWPPRARRGFIEVSRVNGVDRQLALVADALAQLPPSFAKFFDAPAGGFVWRPIAGTERLSGHAYGIAVDINTAPSDYWRDTLKRGEDEARWRNTRPIVSRIPFEVVEAFERHGFIWGGKWYHYDTMHFEYRPELL